MTRIVYCYGGGGKPKPGDNRCVTVSCICENCRKHINPWETSCKHCREPFTGSCDEDDLDKEVVNICPVCGKQTDTLIWSKCRDCVELIKKMHKQGKICLCLDIIYYGRKALL